MADVTRMRLGVVIHGRRPHAVVDFEALPGQTTRLHLLAANALHDGLVILDGLTGPPMPPPNEWTVIGPGHGPYRDPETARRPIDTAPPPVRWRIIVCACCLLQAHPGVGLAFLVQSMVMREAWARAQERKATF